MYISGNYKKFPDRFWGIGQSTTDGSGEDYTQIEFTLFGNPMWSVFKYGRVGPYYRFSYFKVMDSEEGGLLSRGAVPGSELARVSGFGAEVSWDLRDNIFYPLHGTFAQLRYVLYLPLLGSKQDFHRGELDVRQYMRSFREQVLALQCKVVLSSGEVPFQMMPKLGGSTIMRGMYDGRFRDKQSCVVQAEYRMPLFWRFGATLFSSVGQVFSNAEEFSRSNFRTAFGAGGRFSIMEGQRVNCRLDVGFCEGEMAIYFKYQEAF
jgi:outer membrane protein assembly factor BamA